HPRLVYKVMRAMFRTVHTNLMRKNFESEELSHYITKTHGRY
ncbi:MAG: Crp/Fnr family transcriptional regulator, partial [Gammaproteobacteria bacterium]|nr:Crp/Fnr family transcriptional regulator [Gammaproteobacteria bacterium]